MNEHLSRLQNAGFTTVIPWFQCFNFVSILAVKSDSAA
jgi:tRNA (cmo5U34)-methyltransferase